MGMKLEQYKMPSVVREIGGLKRLCRLHFIVINDVIVERILEDPTTEGRHDYDTRLQTRTAVFQDALGVRARKVRGWTTTE